MNPPQNDFRQWIVYNPSLQDDKAIYEVFKAVRDTASYGKFSCLKNIDGESEAFHVYESGGTALILSHDDRSAMIRYLKDHYILGDDPEQWMASAGERSKSVVDKEGDDHPYFMDPKYADYMPQPAAPKKQFVREEPSKWFYNPEPRKHILGYAFVGVIILQFMLIPTNVFDVKFPDFFKYVFSLIFVILQYYAVRNYRNYFLTGGLRYKTVWSITFWLYLILFGVTGFEVAFIDLLNGDNGIGNLIGIPLIMIFLGLFLGWFASLFIYFMNGGKVVTDPNSIKPARH